jgi:hypothetical protein
MLTTLGPGKRATIYLRDSPNGSHVSRHSVILAVEFTGIRIESLWARFDAMLSPKRRAWFFPWANNDSVEIVPESAE